MFLMTGFIDLEPTPQLPVQIAELQVILIGLNVLIECELKERFSMASLWNGHDVITHIITN